MEIVKLLEDMEKTIKEVKELLATFKALQKEIEPIATLERSDIPDSPTHFSEDLEITEPKKRGRKKKIHA